MTTKPEDIPQDVWDVANGIAHRTPTVMNVDHSLAVVVAHAILAEREACARIVQNQSFYPEPTSRAARYYEKNVIRPVLAAAIRKRGEG